MGDVFVDLSIPVLVGLLVGGYVGFRDDRSLWLPMGFYIDQITLTCFPFLPIWPIGVLTGLS